MLSAYVVNHCVSPPQIEGDNRVRCLMCMSDKLANHTTGLLRHMETAKHLSAAATFAEDSTVQPGSASAIAALRDSANKHGTVSGMTMQCPFFTRWHASKRKYK